MAKKKKPEVEEQFIALTKDSVKYATEIPVREINEESIITIEKPGRILENPAAKAKSSSKNPALAKKPKMKSRPINLNPKPEDLETHTPSALKNYTLIITEKPQAAAKIADALADKTASKRNLGGVPYYELSHKGQKIVVACAVGHLFNLAQKEKGSGWPVFNIEWKPNFLISKKDFTKKYYAALVSLSKKASSFIVATDLDIEGEIIGLNVIRFIAHQKDAKRMKFSTLTQNEIVKAFENPSATLEWGSAYAGETRHVLDWLYGINLSRALMDSIKKAGSFKIMSIGRVQGPTLHLIVDKELQIQAFKPSTYWEIFIKVNGIELKHVKEITKKAELKQFEALKGKKAQATTQKSTQHIQPPTPFDLTTLQTESYRYFSLTPARTLQIAQSLYLSGAISYPRTSSQKIPNTIDTSTILKKLSFDYPQTKLAVRSQPIEGKKSDPAHPSIYPTGDAVDSMSSEEQKVYDLISRRFISCFCPDAVVDNKLITVICEGLKFTARGAEIKDQGWMKVYKSAVKEKDLPDLNGEVTIQEVRIDEKQTQPPHRYSPASIVSELEKRNLGTKATRANIIETLYDRNYIQDTQIKATAFGIALIQALKKHSPVIIDEALTRAFEKDMDSFQQNKDMNAKKLQIIDKAEKTLVKITDDFRKKEKEIGEELVAANKEAREQEKEASKLIQCPKCQKGFLAIKFSPQYHKSFLGCTAYPECRNTVGLPNGLIKKTDKTCKECNWPMLLRIAKEKRPWFFCPNPNCKTRLDKNSTIETQKPEE